MNQIKGVIAPLLAPVTEEEEINHEQLARLTRHVVEGGVDGIFVNGTTGEFGRFSRETRTDIVKTVVKASAGRVPVYAGISDCGTRAVIQNMKEAEAAGADAVVATLPFYFPNTSRYEERQFIQEIGEAAAVPVLLYNIPAAVGNEISLDVLEEAARMGQIAGIKDSSGDQEYMDQLLKRFGDKEFRVIVGDERMIYYGLSHGADGLVPSLANPFPRLLAQVYKCACEKDWEGCRKYCQVVDDMNRLNGFSDSWMSPNIWRKTALKLMDIMDDNFTHPYCPVDAETEKEVKKEVERYYRMFNLG